MNESDTSLQSDPTRRSWWRLFRIIALALLAFVLLGAAIFYIWASNAAVPMPEAMAALSSNEKVSVSEKNSWLVFEPSANTANTGFIFYPGGRVDHRAYAPMLNALAQEGYLAATTDMPLNLAFFAINKADGLVTEFPEIDRWIMGGHSLGGVAAARYARTHPDTIDGLVLWASFPAGSDSIAARSDLAVVSIYGTNDGLMAVDEIEASGELLPPQSVFVPIEGGNHAQFGWYGAQSGDNPATIDRLDQQQKIIAGTLIALEQLQEDN